MTKKTFAVFTEEAYHELSCTSAFYGSVAGGWISEDAFNAMSDEKNISPFIFDLNANCTDSAIFADYGLSDLSNHEQAVALANMIMEHGF